VEVLWINDESLWPKLADWVRVVWGTFVPEGCVPPGVIGRHDDRLVFAEMPASDLEIGASRLAIDYGAVVKAHGLGEHGL
jgi:hypothetical protein